MARSSRSFLERRHARHPSRPRHSPEPYFYDAFRFSWSKEVQVENSNGTTKASERSHLEHKNTGLVTTPDVFLPFGYGRHACPGRFLIAVEVELLLAYMVMI